MASNQMQILQALIEADDPEAIPILIDCLGSNHHATVRFAAESIGAMAKKQKDICNMAVSELVDSLASENAQIRKSVLNTLLLLDIPLCYSSAISNVVRGDNQPYNKTIAKKIIQNIISNDSSVKYDNFSEPSSTFKQGAEVRKVDHDTASKSVEPHIRFDQGVIKNVSAVMPDVNAEFYDFRDFLKSDYPSKDSQMDSSEEPDLSCAATVLVDDKESVAVGFNEDHAGDFDEKSKLSSPDYEHSGLTSKPLGVHAADNQDCEDNSDCATGVFDYEFSDKLVIDEHYNEIMQSHDPEEFIPASLYNQWRAALLESTSANQNLVALAEEINLHWATTRFDETVSDYLPYDLKSIRSIPTFGRKKTRTLILCVMHAAYKLDRVGFQNDCTISDNNDVIKETLTFEELLACDRPVGKISEELWQRWCQAIGKTPAADMKIAEIAARYKLVWPYMKRLELVSKYLDFSLHKITHLYTFGNKKIRTLVLCIASLILDSVPSENPQTIDMNEYEQPIQGNIELCDITNCVQNVLANLSDREQHVAKKRYGFDGESPCTLEEIAGVLGVTRERVRQIQIKVVERFKVSALGTLLPDMLSKLDADDIWARLSSFGVIYKADVNRAFEKQLNGEFMLALECCGMTVATWLSTIATEGALAWYRSSFSQYELAMLLMKLEVLIQQAGMPLPLPSIRQHLGISENDAGMLICLSSKYKMFDGFTFEGSIGARARRTVHLHQLLNSETTFLSLQNLVALHNYQFPKESCTTRDADIVMREAPHLFVMLGDKGWCSIGSYQADKNYRPEPSITDNDAAQQTDPVETADDSNVTSIITAILRNRGISNFMDIVSEFQNIAGNTYSAHSVGPTLLMRDDFVKFAPSIYGLREHLKGFGVSTSDLLLNDHDCQLFIMARYAGEDFGTFRLWNPVMEYKWYKWLDKHPNDQLRESFCYIAKPDEWPVHNAQVEELKYKIKQLADTYYFLREPKYVGNSLPDIRSIYALIRYAKDNGSINWIAANLVLGRRIDDYHIVVDIAFLVCFGALEPACNWQMLHKAKDDVTDIENKLSNMLHCGQGADWKSPAGEFLLDIFTININVNNMGWVDISALNSLFHHAPTPISAENVQDAHSEENAFSLVGAMQVSSTSPALDGEDIKLRTVETETVYSVPSKVNLAAVIILDDLKLDPVSHQVWRSGQEIELTQKEYGLLLYLMRNPNMVLSRKEINDNAFENAADSNTNIVDVYFNYLRKKVDNDFPTKLIHTVRGEGYILQTLSGECVSGIEIETGTELSENHADLGRGAVMYFDDLKLDPVSHWVWRAEQRIEVTAKEYSLLLYFMRNPGVVISREMINDNVFEGAVDRSSNIIDVYVSYLRNKVDKDFTSKLIHTVRGEGYILRTIDAGYAEREVNVETERNESILPDTVFQHVETPSTKTVLEETPTIDCLPQEVEILPKECENSIPDNSPPIPKQRADILLQALKTALNPEDLISDEMWSSWSQKLLGSSFASKMIHTVANQNSLPWPVTKEYESFDEYLGLPLNRISKTLAWKHNRTILLCVANAALKLDPETKYLPTRQGAIKPEVNSKNNSEVGYKELIKSDNPIGLITSEMWNDWRTLIIKHDATTRYISDMVDELGSLHWQARWKYEKLSEYYLYSLDDIREIKFPGKSSTIVICMAKAATDVLVKLSSRSSKKSDELSNTGKYQENMSDQKKLKYHDTSFEFMSDKHLEKDNDNKKIIESIIEDFF